MIVLVAMLLCNGISANDGLSDSEVEDAPDARVTLPQDFVGRGNRKTQKRYPYASAYPHHYHDVLI